MQFLVGVPNERCYIETCFFLVFRSVGSSYTVLSLFDSVTYKPTDWPTNCMQHNPSWIVYSSFGIGKTPPTPTLWKPKVHNRVQNSSLLVPILSQINPVHALPSCSFKAILITSHLCLDLTSSHFPSDFPMKTSYAFLYSSIRATCPAHLVLPQLSVLTIFGEEYRQRSSSLCNFLQPSAISCHFLSMWRSDVLTENSHTTALVLESRVITGRSIIENERCYYWQWPQDFLGVGQQYVARYSALLPQVLEFRGVGWNRSYRKCSPSQQASLRRPTLQNPYDQRVTCTIIMFCFPRVSSHCTGNF